MENMFRMFNRINKLVQKNCEIYIRCAGDYGKQLCYEMRRVNIPITAFLDCNETNTTIMGIPVLPPETVYEKKTGTFFVMIAVAQDEIYRQICNELIGHNLKPIIDFGDFSFQSDFRMNTYENVIPNYDVIGAIQNRVRHELDIAKQLDLPICNEIPDAYNLLPTLDVKITTYCSMSCPHCAHHIPYAKHPTHFDENKILEDLDKLLSVSYVTTVGIMGGEPFCYPNLISFIKKYAQLEHYGNIGYTRIVTNGTILPTDDFFIACHNLKNFYIHISNYGVKSTQIDALVQKCKEFSIKCIVMPYSDSWYVLDDFNVKRDYTSEQLQHLYAACAFRYCFQLSDGKFSSCCRVPILNEDEYIPYSGADFCNIRDEDILKLKENLHSYIYKKQYLNTCQYCDGIHRYTSKIQRGE